MVVERYDVNPTFWQASVYVLVRMPQIDEDKWRYSLKTN